MSGEGGSYPWALVTPEPDPRNKRIADLEAALLAIKRLCSGDRQHNWADNMAVTQTRVRIADLCEIADQK